MFPPTYCCDKLQPLETEAPDTFFSTENGSQGIHSDHSNHRMRHLTTWSGQLEINVVTCHLKFMNSLLDSTQKTEEYFYWLKKAFCQELESIFHEVRRLCDVLGNALPGNLGS